MQAFEFTVELPLEEQLFPSQVSIHSIAGLLPETEVGVHCVCGARVWVFLVAFVVLGGWGGVWEGGCLEDAQVLNLPSSPL